MSCDFSRCPCCWERPCYGQPPLPRYEVHRAPTRITIDGKPDEKAWAAAPAVELIFPWEAQTGAKQKTTARLLWDDDFLYVSYECADTDIVAQYTERDDPTYKDDTVEIFINPEAHTDRNLFRAGDECPRGALRLSDVRLAVRLEALQHAGRATGVIHPRDAECARRRRHRLEPGSCDPLGELRGDGETSRSRHGVDL